MKKICSFLLVLVMVLALAACGETKPAEVVADSSAKDTAIETPPPQPIVEVTTSPAPEYQNVNYLPSASPTSPPSSGTASASPSSGTPGASGTTTVPNTGTAVSVEIPVSTPAAGGTQTGTTQTGTQTGTTQPTGNNEDNYQITFADDSGEMYYPTATDAEKNNGKIGYTNVELANLRVGPGKQYKIYESLRKDVELKVLAIDGDWAKVWYDGHILGYVFKDFITYAAPPASAVAPAPASGESAEVIITGNP